MTKKIYNYHPETGRLLSEALADESPREPGIYIIPAHATDLMPPPTLSGYVPVYVNSQWEVEENAHVPSEYPILQDRPITPPSIPAVSPWQIRKALNQVGLRASVEAAVAQGSQDVKDGWEFATEFRRHDPLVEQLGAALSKTEAELDSIFILAATL